MRVGVDLQNPWDSFDTNTVKKADLDAYDEADESCSSGAEIQSDEYDGAGSDDSDDGMFDDALVSRSA